MSKKRKTKLIPDIKQIAVWCITVIISIVFIYGAHALVTDDLDVFNAENAYADKALVTAMGLYVEDSHDAGAEYIDATQYFYAEILSGERKGQKVLAAQTSDNYSNYDQEPVNVGDKVILYNYGTPQGDAEYIFGGYERLDANIGLIIAFFVLLIVFGLFKGVNTIISLGFTCLAVFYVYVPSILTGYNIYLMTCITCVFTIIMTLLITNGATYKSLTTILGCGFGVALAAVITLIYDKVLRLTGYLDEHSIYLQYLSSGVEINLNALIFGMIVVGAMGAVMDVAMDISSSLYEVHIQAPHLKFNELFMSGIRIGRDVMGTMANTLVLAYIGSSLCSILLLITYSSSILELLNRENIAVEILQAMVGSTAILLTIPLTSLVCAFVYTDKHAQHVKTSIRNNNIPSDLSEFREWKPKKNTDKELQKTDNKTEEYKSFLPEDKPIDLYYTQANLKIAEYLKRTELEINEKKAETDK